MIRWIKKLFKLALLLAIVALIFNFHYKGKSARDYAREYGMKTFHYVYGRAKALMGKDLEELAPKSLSEIPGKIKELTAGPEKGEADMKISKGTETAPSKGDALTEEDREALRKLLEQKSKKKQ